jgi:3-hydroxyacyl-[acyl-carrier protein] dehydratase/trans-2-decenoyl-[acyl-carrier protein] isomerase
MHYQEFLACSSLTAAEVLAFAHGELIDDPPEGFTARLPTPPMLMVDTVNEISSAGRGGRIVAERRVRLDDWFFQCHFKGDPVQPGCLGVDAVWQLIGFYCAWKGAVGGGRALGCGDVSFDGQIRPMDEMVRYEIDVRRYTFRSGAGIAIADARVLVDDQCIYTIGKARAGIFPDIAYANYPRPSDKARGGLAQT